MFWFFEEILKKKIPSIGTIFGHEIALIWGYCNCQPCYYWYYFLNSRVGTVFQFFSQFILLNPNFSGQRCLLTWLYGFWRETNVKNGGLEGTWAWGHWHLRNGKPKLLEYFEELWAPQILPYTRSTSSTRVARVSDQSLGHESRSFHDPWPRTGVGKFIHLFHHKTIPNRGANQYIWFKAYWGNCDHATCKTLPRSTQIKKQQDWDHDCSGSFAESVTVDNKHSG